VDRRLPGLHPGRDDLQPGDLYNLAKNTVRPAGLDNFAALFDDPKAMLSLKKTLLYAVMAVPLEICFALMLALLLNRVGRSAGVPDLLLPAEDDPGRRDGVGLLPAVGRNTGAVNQALAVIGIGDPHCQRNDGDLPGRPQNVPREL
jgi:multiple sugar transport system permease protein